jgi:hypothetical protein
MPGSTPNAFYQVFFRKWHLGITIGDPKLAEDCCPKNRTAASANRITCWLL